MSQALAKADLAALPVAERLQLIEDIWDSIDDTAALPLQDWQREEIDRRLQRLADGTSIGTPWADVRRRITGRP